MKPERSGAKTEASCPDAKVRLKVCFVPAPHPAVLAPDQLLVECNARFQRRSGPGGQHRNKTSSGVFLHHEPTGIVGEATERRSQADNRSMALQRLRFRLAVEVRTLSILDGSPSLIEAGIRQSFAGQSLRMNDANTAKPAALALVLNDLHAAGGQPSIVAPLWNTSTSSIVSLVKSHHGAFIFVNTIRAHHNRRALK